MTPAVAEIVCFVGWVERSDTHHRAEQQLMGIASLHPSLYGAVEVQRQAWPRTPLAAGISVSLFDRGRFFVPTAMLWSAARSRGQGWPALRGRGRRHRIQATP